METPASIHRHPVHTILVAIPIGLWVFSFACDLAVLATDVEQVANFWYAISYYAMLGGLAGALLAAVPGVIDYWSLNDRDVRQLASGHLTINLLVVVIYAVNLWVRADETSSFGAAMAMSGLGLALLAFSVWVGMEMVHFHRGGIVEADTAPKASASAETRLAPGATRMGHALDYWPR